MAVAEASAVAPKLFREARRASPQRQLALEGVTPPYELDQGSSYEALEEAL